MVVVVRKSCTIVVDILGVIVVIVDGFEVEGVVCIVEIVEVEVLVVVDVVVVEVVVVVVVAVELQKISTFNEMTKSNKIQF